MTSSTAPIDLTSERDHLTALPAELLHLIFDYVLPNHEPDRAFDREAQAKSPFNKSHPIQVLSHTCRTLRGEVHSWAKHWLKSHRPITKYTELRSENARAKHDQRGWLWGHGGLLTWMGKHCVFCGKHSQRRAILASGFMCCKDCDRKEWPEKIIKTKAMHDYDLKLHHLFPGKRKPTNVDHMRPWPRIHYGTYISSNVATTMFLVDEVKRLAEAVHGDLDAYKEMKLLKKKERDAKKQERMRLKAEAERRKESVWRSKEMLRERDQALRSLRTEVLGSADCPIDLDADDDERTASGLIDLSADD